MADKRGLNLGSEGVQSTLSLCSMLLLGDLGECPPAIIRLNMKAILAKDVGKTRQKSV